MDTEFFEAFNSTIPEMEAEFQEDWVYKDKTWPAIAIDDMQLSQMAAAPGGALSQAKVTLYVRSDIFTASGVVKGAIIQARGEKVRVMTIGNDGDASRIMICGPVSAPIPQG